MSDIKEELISAIRDLPPNVSYEDIMELILIREKVALGLKQVEEGKVISDDIMEKEFLQRQEKRQKANR